MTLPERPSYGGGRMAPHEWVRSGSAVLKSVARDYLTIKPPSRASRSARCAIAVTGLPMNCDAWTRIVPDPRSERDVSTRSAYLLKLHDQHCYAVTEPL